MCVCVCVCVTPRSLWLCTAIIRADGDVVKFAGDALLAFWPCSKYEAVKTVQHVIRMCLGLQSTLDKYQTVDGVVLRMKLGVSVGPMEMYHIGECIMRK